MESLEGAGEVITADEISARASLRAHHSVRLFLPLRLVSLTESSICSVDLSSKSRRHFQQRQTILLCYSGFIQNIMNHVIIYWNPISLKTVVNICIAIQPQPLSLIYTHILSLTLIVDYFPTDDTFSSCPTHMCTRFPWLCYLALCLFTCSFLCLHQRRGIFLLSEFLVRKFHVKNLKRETLWNSYI